MPSAIASVELVTQLKDVQIATMGMVASKERDLVARAKEQLTSRKTVLQKALHEQMAQANSDSQRGLVKEAEESLTNYFSAIDDTAKFKLAGQDAMAEANMSATRSTNTCGNRHRS